MASAAIPITKFQCFLHSVKGSLQEQAHRGLISSIGEEAYTNFDKILASQIERRRGSRSTSRCKATVTGGRTSLISDTPLRRSKRIAAQKKSKTSRPTSSSSRQLPLIPSSSSEEGDKVLRSDIWNEEQVKKQIEEEEEKQGQAILDELLYGAQSASSHSSSSLPSDTRTQEERRRDCLCDLPPAVSNAFASTRSLQDDFEEEEELYFLELEAEYAFKTLRPREHSVGSLSKRWPRSILAAPRRAGDID